MINKFSLKTQFIISFVAVITLSLLATLITQGLIIGLWLKFGDYFMLPANHYEKQLPSIHRSIHSQGKDLLLIENKEQLEKVIPSEGFKYQVLDSKGKILYGSISEPVSSSTHDLILKLNTKLSQDNKIREFLPLTDANGTFSGAIVIEYALEPIMTRSWSKIIFFFIIFLLIITPFIYILLFTLIFARRFGRSIHEPVQALIEGAHRIQQRDLDFSLDYQADNEIGKLTRSFEKMRLALKESLLREWRLEEERREMILSISHDLSTPLTIIQGHVQTLLDARHLQPDRVQRYLKVIDQNTQFVGQLVKELNEISKIEEPNFTINPEWVDIVPFLETKAEEYEWMCRQQKISFEFTCEDKRSKRLQSLDLERLGRVFNNLMSNSIRFTPAQGKITWHAHLENSVMKFTLSDTGPGFSAKDIPHLFKKFYQGDPSRGEKGHYGLGLFISQKIIHKHNGVIKVGNTQEGGAKISITINC
jgi:two-component system, OmpR family, lantibiotic biosynthesis sensor histidine kinase NisK/SpaK